MIRQLLIGLFEEHILFTVAIADSGISPLKLYNFSFGPWTSDDFEHLKIQVLKFLYLTYPHPCIFLDLCCYHLLQNTQANYYLPRKKSLKGEKKVNSQKMEETKYPTLITWKMGFYFFWCAIIVASTSLTIAFCNVTPYSHTPAPAHHQPKNVQCNMCTIERERKRYKLWRVYMLSWDA